MLCFCKSSDRLRIVFYCFIDALSVDPDVPSIPISPDGPIRVKVGLYFESVSGVDTSTMTYNIDLYVRSSWRDDRLSHNNSEGIWLRDSRIIDKIWLPDFYFSSSIEARFQTVTKPNHVLFIAQDGTTSYSVRVALVSSCHLNLRKYPLDDQICHLVIRSYSYTVEYLNMTWFDGPVTDVIQANAGVEVPDFKILRRSLEYCDGLYTFPYTGHNLSTHQFSCLRVNLHLRRAFNFHLVQTYCPMTLTVIISFVAFWIDRGAVPARVTLSVTSLLTVTTQAAGIRYSLPPVSYAKAIDYWVLTCVGFVFSGLLEYAFVNSLMARSQRRADTAAGKRKAKKITDAETNLKLSLQLSQRAYKIDLVCRVLFPVAFLLFVAVYVTYYYLHEPQKHTHY